MAQDDLGTLRTAVAQGKFLSAGLAAQFIRAAQLLVLPSIASLKDLPTPEQQIQRLQASHGDAVDLSNLRFKFAVSAADVETPNTAVVRVYNLSKQLADFIQNSHEFGTVVLEAGYQSNLGQIFIGTIKQFRRGRERNVDNFLELLCSDGDFQYNFGVVNRSIAAGTKPSQQAQTIADQMGLATDPKLLGALDTGGILPRGKVLFGNGRAMLRDLSNTANCRWSIQSGKLVIIPNDSFLDFPTVSLNSLTGLVGVPEATDNGILVDCLLNPLLQVGGTLRINNGDITATQVQEFGFPEFTNKDLFAQLSPALSPENDGVYRMLVIEHEGDTRGEDWLSHVTCVSVAPGVQPATGNPQSTAPTPVRPFG